MTQGWSTWSPSFSINHLFSPLSSTPFPQAYSHYWILLLNFFHWIATTIIKPSHLVTCPFSSLEEMAIQTWGLSWCLQAESAFQAGRTVVSVKFLMRNKQGWVWLKSGEQDKRRYQRTSQEADSQDPRDFRKEFGFYLEGKGKLIKLAQNLVV